MALPAPTNNYAPTTDYNTAVKEVAATYAPSYKQITTAQNQALADKNTNLSQLLENKNTGLSSLNQAKANAFKNIGYTANARGVLFSGYSPYQQNEYTVNTYNPGVKNVNTAYNRGVLSTNTAYSRAMQTLADKLASLRQQQANAAQSLVNASQPKVTASYGGSRSSGGSGASGSSAGSFSGTPTNQKVSAALRTYVESKNLFGGDGHVAPSTLAAMYNTWKDYGLTDKAFWAAFQGLWNPKQANYGAQFNAARNAR